MSEANTAGGDFFFPAPVGGSIPQVEDGLGLARFDNISIVLHEEWATDKNNYGKPDDGRRHHFDFTIMETKTSPLFGEDGDPVELTIKTSMATGKRSLFREIMSGLLTPAENEAFLASTAEKPWTGGRAVVGRVYNVKIAHNPESGYPRIETIIGQVK